MYHRSPSSRNGSTVRWRLAALVLLGIVQCTASGRDARPPGGSASDSTWEARVGVLRSGLADFRTVKGWRVAGDNEFTWTAYFDGDSIRHIREESGQGDFGASRYEYWFGNGRLFAYRAEGTRLQSGKEPSLRRLVIAILFDSSGRPAGTSKLVDGESVPLQPREISAARRRAAELAAEAADILRRQGPRPIRFFADSSLAGTIRLDSGRVLFSPCAHPDSTVPLSGLPVSALGRLRDEAGAGTRRLTALVRKEGGGAWTLRYAATEGPDCSSLYPQGDVTARGNEPFWSADVVGDSIRIHTPDLQDALLQTGGVWSRPESGKWEFTVSQSLRLVITDSGCVDNMSGARFPYRALLLRDGVTNAGCAIEGMRAVAAAEEERAEELQTSLTGSRWRLLPREIAGRDEGVEVTLEFPEPGRVEGTTGCNRFFGKVTLSSRGVSFGPLGMSRKVCSDSIMVQERDYIRWLERSDRILLREGVLELQVPGRDRSLRFTPR